MTLDSLNISRETIQLLKEYQELVIKWNKHINLISSSTINYFWERHIVDSLQLLKFIDNRDICLLDIGSGAGMPGIILSIAGVKDVILVESDSRKSAFLLQAAAISNYKINIINDRVENLSLSCDVLTSRAWTNIDNILKFTQKIKVLDKYLLLKGENYQNELNEARKVWSFNAKVSNSITLEASKIMEIRNPIRII